MITPSSVDYWILYGYINYYDLCCFLCVLICKSTDFCYCMLLVYYLYVIVCFPIMQDSICFKWVASIDKRMLHWQPARPPDVVYFNCSLPARRRPQGLVVIGVCLSVCLSALFLSARYLKNGFMDHHQIWWVGAGGEPLEQVQFWC